MPNTLKNELLRLLNKYGFSVIRYITMDDETLDESILFAIERANAPRTTGVQHLLKKIAMLIEVKQVRKNHPEWMEPRFFEKYHEAHVNNIPFELIS